MLKKLKNKYYANGEFWYCAERENHQKLCEKSSIAISKQKKLWSMLAMTFSSIKTVSWIKNYTLSIDTFLHQIDLKIKV